MTTRTPELARALAQDRWDQAVVRPVVSRSVSGASIETTPEWDRLSEIIHELAARTAGGEVVEFGMRSLVDGLEDTIRERVIDWAVAYMLGERDEDAEGAAA